VTDEQLSLFDTIDRQASPCATEVVRCTTCTLPVCPHPGPCYRCSRGANAEVSAFTWYRPRRSYVVHSWLLSCWWHLGDITDKLRADALTVGPAYLIRWTAQPYGILAAGTSVYADVEQVAA
jgi:hypothetical protein